MKIYIIGYMYAGKSTFGKILAKKLRYNFIDLDRAIETKYRTDINTLFSKYGEEVFRRLEQQTLHDTADLENTVIATGGGTPCFYDNLKWMNQHGKTLYLKMELEAIMSRIRKSKRSRPLLNNKNEEEQRVFISEQLQYRSQFYEQALLTEKGISPDMEEIICKLTNVNTSLQVI